MHPAMAHAVAATGAVQQIRRVGHAFHAARDHDAVGAGRDQVMGQHRRLHARSAHLVDGGAADRFGNAGAERRLTGRRLAQPGRQHAAHDDFLDRVRGEAGPLDGGANRGGAQFRRGRGGKVALEAAHGGADGRNDNDRVVALVFGTHGYSPLIFVHPGCSAGLRTIVFRPVQASKKLAGSRHDPVRM